MDGATYLGAGALITTAVIASMAIWGIIDWASDWWLIGAIVNGAACVASSLAHDPFGAFTHGSIVGSFTFIWIKWIKVSNSRRRRNIAWLRQDVRALVRRAKTRRGGRF